MGLSSMRTILSAMTPEQLERRYENGRGRGEGPDYLPWLYVREVKSRGMSHVRKGIVVDRDFHLLSNIENAAFLCCERLPRVIDIREQFPLWPISSTVDIAAAFGIVHPRTPGSPLDNLMTTDLVLTTQDGRTVPIHVKPARELLDRRTQQKLDIERDWWRQRGSDLRVVTERELPADLVSNLDAASQHHGLEQCSVGDVAADDAAGALLDAIRRRPGVPAATVAGEVDAALGLATGVSLSVFWHLIARRRARIDMRARFDSAKPFALIP